MKVSDWVAEELVRLGIKHVFTLCGGFSMHLNDSIGHSSLIPIYMLHESGAAFAANAYAQYTGGLGVCVVTSGPGSTNAITGLASAWDDSLPVLYISGEANLPVIEQRRTLHLRQGGPQDVEIEEIVRPITKLAITIKSPKTIIDYFGYAVNRALTQRRGPVWIAVPLDVSAMDMPNE